MLSEWFLHAYYSTVTVDLGCLHICQCKVKWYVDVVWHDTVFINWFIIYQSGVAVGTAFERLALCCLACFEMDLLCCIMSLVLRIYLDVIYSKHVRRQTLKYFGHVTRHNGLEKTIMQGMVAGKRSWGKPRQRWEKDIADTFGTMTAASRVAEDRHQFRMQRHLCSDVLKRICSEKKIFYTLCCLNVILLLFRVTAFFQDYTHMTGSVALCIHLT